MICSPWLKSCTTLSRKAQHSTMTWNNISCFTSRLPSVCLLLPPSFPLSLFTDELLHAEYKLLAPCPLTLTVPRAGSLTTQFLALFPTNYDHLGVALTTPKARKPPPTPSPTAGISVVFWGMDHIPGNHNSEIFYSYKLSVIGKNIYKLPSQRIFRRKRKCKPQKKTHNCF